VVPTGGDDASPLDAARMAVDGGSVKPAVLKSPRTVVAILDGQVAFPAVTGCWQAMENAKAAAVGWWMAEEAAVNGTVPWMADRSAEAAALDETWTGAADAVCRDDEWMGARMGTTAPDGSWMRMGGSNMSRSAVAGWDRRIALLVVTGDWQAALEELQVVILPWTAGVKEEREGPHGCRMTLGWWSVVM